MVALTLYRSILGPFVGGALARPCFSYPDLFPPGTIFEQFPFLLPNLACTSVVVLGVLVGFLFLEETHHEKKYERDVGLEMGKLIVAIFQHRLKTENRISLISGETDLLIDNF